MSRRPRRAARSDDAGADANACQAGASPKSTPVSTATAAVNSSTRRSGCTSNARCAAAPRRIAPGQHEAHQRAGANIRQRDAEQAARSREQQRLGQHLPHQTQRGRRRATTRKANSRCLAAPRASSRLATLVQAISRSRPTMAISTRSGRRIDRAARRTPPPPARLDGDLARTAARLLRLRHVLDALAIEHAHLRPRLFDRRRQASDARSRRRSTSPSQRGWLGCWSIGSIAAGTQTSGSCRLGARRTRAARRRRPSPARR